MDNRTLSNFISREITCRWFLLSRSKINVPGKRVLITADLDEPVFDSHIQRLLELLSSYQVALTLFCPNRSAEGEESYAVLEQIHEFALNRNLTVEFASHSISHEPLPKKDPPQVASIIQESIFSFRERGIPVYGFRSPYLSTESEYRIILRELGLRDGLIQYDSSTLFEGNMLTSHIHDYLSWKSPHVIEGIWELPISCLDDYHLFERYAVEEHQGLAYWRRKVERCLWKYKYFLLLIHPSIIGRHLRVLENVLAFCRQTYPDIGFVTGHEFVEELNAVGKEQVRE
jgi:peptidoglycan/xylan/chitin deacetylase (PgdA/CDA1 family)